MYLQAVQPCQRLSSKATLHTMGKRTPSPVYNLQGVLRDQVNLTRFSSTLNHTAQALNAKYKGPAFNVNWNCWAVGDRYRHPLATTGLETCRALIIVDERKQFLAHILDTTTEEDIIGALQQAKSKHKLDIDNGQIYIIQGSMDNDDLEQFIQEAIQVVAPGQENSIETLYREKTSSTPVGVSVVGGDVYLCKSPKPVPFDLQESIISP